MRENISLEEKVYFIRKYYKEYTVEWLMENRVRTHQIYLMTKKDDTKKRVAITLANLEKERKEKAVFLHNRNRAKDLSFYNE